MENERKVEYYAIADGMKIDKVYNLAKKNGFFDREVTISEWKKVFKGICSYHLLLNYGVSNDGLIRSCGKNSWYQQVYGVIPFASVRTETFPMTKTRTRNESHYDKRLRRWISHEVEVTETFDACKYYFTLNENAFLKGIELTKDKKKIYLTEKVNELKAKLEKYNGMLATC